MSSGYHGEARRARRASACILPIDGKFASHRHRRSATTGARSDAVHLWVPGMVLAHQRLGRCPKEDAMQFRLIALTMVLALPAGGWAMGNGKGHGRPEPVDCPADVGLAVAAQCPCEGQSNHGQYVRCVVHYRNALRKAGCLDAAAKRSMARCAARSTCGKVDRVLCCMPNPGTCNDPAPGNMAPEGVCNNDTTVACDTNDDCLLARARIARDETQCTADGGTPGGQGSICGACTTSTTTTTVTTTTTTTTVP